jgi:uncharacterized protein
MKHLLLTLLLYANFATCQQKESSDGVKNLPQLEKSINDFEDLLLPHQEVILNGSVKSFYEQSGIEIIVVTVKSIEPYDDIFEYSLALAKSSNRGDIIIVVCKKLHGMQIQNSNGILGKLTNDETKDILDTFILPRFREDKYFDGLLDGIAEIKKELY